MELDYYPLKRAAKDIDCTTEDLICLAADGKLPIYVRGINRFINVKEDISGDGDYLPFEQIHDVLFDEKFLPDVFRVVDFTIIDYQNDSATCLTYLVDI